MQPHEVERFRKGERESFERVFREHAADVRRVAQRFFRSAFEQDDVLQEIWMNVWRQSATYNPEKGALMGWLKTIAANLCRDKLRAQGRTFVEYSDEADGLASEDNAEEKMASVEFQAALENFCTRLPEDEARALKAGALAGVSHAELAATLGVSERQSKYLKKKLLARAMKDKVLFQVVGK